MFTTHPAILTNLAEQHVEQLVDQATTHRLAAVLSRSRRQRWPDAGPANRLASSPAGPASDTPGVSYRAGRLSTCEVSTGPAR
jgi:hypothetical protein